jgi:predicted metalloprotease
MRLDEQQESGNVEDRRGMSPGMLRGGGLGCGGLLIVLVISYFTGIDPRQLLQTVEQAAPPASTTQTAPTGKPADTLGKFAAKVLGSTEQVWTQVIASNNRRYTPPTMVLFAGAVQSACGTATSASGPFYCPNDGRLYLDTSFFDELDRLGGSGDFAQAYVIAHEIGHHVQHQLGISDKVHNARASQQRGEEGMSVRLELQADCFAGIWAHASDDKKILDPGDIDEALTAAAAIGDDRLQKQSGGRVNPESWTHGSSAQRSRWFKTGYERASVDACDTFGTTNP